MSTYTLYHLGILDPRGDLQRVCFLPAGEGDELTKLGARARILPAQVIADTRVRVPNGVAVCVACCTRLRARGQVPFTREALRVLRGGAA